MSTVLAISRYDNRSVIELKTGRYMNRFKAMASHPKVKNLELITQKQALELNKVNSHFNFFNNFINKKGLNIVKGFSVYSEYIKLLGNVSHENFYALLIRWAKENQFDINIKSRFLVRYIYLVR